jgi:hypothetical protein
MNQAGRGRGANGTTAREGARGRRVVGFARRRVAAFSAVALAVAGVALAPTACSSPVQGTALSFDAAPPPLPGPCVVKQAPVAACEAGPPSVVDAGTDADDAEAADASDPGDAAPDASGPVVAPASQNRCLVTEDVAIECPSVIGSSGIAAGQEGASDVLLAQRGLGFHASPQSGGLTNDDQAHLQLIHLDARGAGTITMDPVPPYSGKSPATSGALLVPGGARAASLLTFAEAPNGASSMRIGGAAFEVPKSSMLGIFAAASGEGFLTAQPAGGISGEVTLVRGLPDAPRSVRSTTAGWRLITATTDPSGTPVGLFGNIGENSVRILEGESFAKERWSAGSRSGAALDLVYVDEPGGTVPAVLLGDLDGEVTARFARSAANEGHAVLGKSFSTCDRSTYVGVTCDRCPVDKSCEIGSDQMRAVRLFTRAGRLFAAYFSTDVRHRMGYSLDKTPIIGLGCVCALTERDTRELADSLVVIEIVASPDGKTPPSVVEYMRLPVSKARATGTVQLAPRSDGDVDVLLGPATGRFDDVLTQLPENPALLRVLRISTKDL